MRFLPYFIQMLVIAIVLFSASIYGQESPQEGERDKTKTPQQEWEAGDNFIDAILTEKPASAPEKKPEPTEKARPAESEADFFVLIPEPKAKPAPAKAQPEEKKDKLPRPQVSEDEFEVQPDAETSEVEPSPEKVKPKPKQEWEQGDELIEKETEKPISDSLEDELAEGEEFVEDEFEGVAFVTPDMKAEMAQGSGDVNKTLKAAPEREKFSVFDSLGYLRRTYLPPEVQKIYRIPTYFRTQYFFKELEHEKRHVQNALTMKFEFTPKLGPLSFFFTPELNIDDFGGSEGFYAFTHLDDNGEKRSILSLYEVYVKTKAGPFDLSVGKRIYAWGAALGPNPTDIINPYDLIDPIEGSNIDNNRKIGIWSFQTKLYLPSWGILEYPIIEAIFVPRFTRNREAFANSRWYVDSSGGATVEEKFPAHTLENSQWAFRFKGNIKGWDFSVSYYDGIDHAASYQISDETTLVKFYDNVRVVGFDFVTTFGAYKIYFEGIHHWSKEQLQDDYFNIIFGGDITKGPLLGEYDQLNVAVQIFFNRLVTRRTSNDVVRTGEDSGDRGLILYITYKINEQWSTYYSTVFNFNEDLKYTGSFHELRIAYKINLNFIASLKAQFFQGNAADNYGAFSDNNNVFLTLDYTF